MTISVEQLVRVGQAINACYAPDFLSGPPPVVPGDPAALIMGSDVDAPRPFGVIYFDQVLGAIVCAIRGTETFTEWLEDAAAILIDCPFLPGTRSHLGFTKLYQTLTAGGVPLRTYLNTLNRPIIVTGHSLGAALATLAAVDLGGADLVTFAGPRVGDDSFAHAGMSRLASNYRLVNDQDLVPKVPARIDPDFPFAHLGVAMEYNSAGIVRPELEAYHNLGTYLHLIDPLLPVDPRFALAAP